MYKIGIKSSLMYLTEVLLFNRKRFNKCLKYSMHYPIPRHNK